MSKKKEDLEAVVGMTAEETADAAVSEVAETDDLPDEPVSQDPVTETPAPKPKRTRKKKADAVDGEALPKDTADSTEEIPSPEETYAAARTDKPKEAPILTIEAHRDVMTGDDFADLAWHEIRNSYRTNRILTGYLGGLEQNDAGKTIAVVEYKGYRVLIPMKEMAVGMPTQLSGPAYEEMITQYQKLFNKMMGCQIDFIVRGIDSKTKSVVASRAQAMLKKRNTFYVELTDEGTHRISEGRIVQARVIAVAEKTIRIEAFGVECTIFARDLSWDWLGDAHERFSVGDEVLVRILQVNNREDIEHITIKADVKSVSDNSSRENLQKCRIQGKYAGKITDVHKGVVFIRLTNGVNAIAHTCLDRRMPGKKDDVSFAVTHIDEEQGVAVGIITRIIKQHI